LDLSACHELKQPFGADAKKTLSALVFGKEVSVLKIDMDRYGRTVGRVYQDRTDVNLEMVKAGAAWAYKKYLSDPSILEAETAARSRKAGLWALQADQIMPPWDWRKERRP
jgi:endonuclease YncB( thermonuclease family)